VFSSVSKLFFTKLKFKGKGYYIFKNYRNTVAFQFGYSHAARTSIFFVATRFPSKSVILLFGVDYFDTVRAGHLFMCFKRINIFTGRGMRFTRQVIYKKMGKISSYT
jgi:ribosomal protein L6P/L9E